MKKLLTNLLFLACFSMSFAQAPTNGLVGFYPFSNSSGDFSGNNINPVVTGTTFTLDRFNNPNSAVHFNGSSDKMVLTHNESKINFNLDYTISLWFKSELAPNSDFTLLSSRHKINGDENGGVELVSENGTNSSGTTKRGLTAIRVAGCFFQLTDTTAQNLKWTNLTLVAKKSNSKFYFYKDGILSDSAFVSNCPNLTTGSSPIIIGANVSWNNGWFSYFKGTMDDIRIYNRALANSEVITLYNEGKCFEKVMVSDTLRITGTILGLNDLPSNFGMLKIYPNPTRDILNISTNNPSGKFSIKIVNSTSQTVYSSLLTQSITQLNMSSLGTYGLYMIQILDESNKVLETKKLILE